MDGKDEILKAIRDVKIELTEEIQQVDRRFKTVMFGPEDQGGRGGLVRCVTNLESTVYGDPSAPDDRGLVGRHRDLHETVCGRDGLKSKVERHETDIGDIKRKGGILGTGLGLAQGLAWIKLWLGGGG